jgi:hypothetical protein
MVHPLAQLDSVVVGQVLWAAETDSPPRIVLIFILIAPPARPLLAEAGIIIVIAVAATGRRADAVISVVPVVIVLPRSDPVSSTRTFLIVSGIIELVALRRWRRRFLIGCGDAKLEAAFGATHQCAGLQLCRSTQFDLALWTGKSFATHGTPRFGRRLRIAESSLSGKKVAGNAGGQSEPPPPTR